MFSTATGRRLGAVMLDQLHAQGSVAGARSDRAQPHRCPLDACPVHDLRQALFWSNGARGARCASLACLPCLCLPWLAAMRAWHSVLTMPPGDGIARTEALMH